MHTLNTLEQETVRESEKVLLWVRQCHPPLESLTFETWVQVWLEMAKFLYDLNLNTITTTQLQKANKQASI
jgi:hypothetical protein